VNQLCSAALLTLVGCSRGATVRPPVAASAEPAPHGGQVKPAADTSGSAPAIITGTEAASLARAYLAGVAGDADPPSHLYAVGGCSPPWCRLQEDTTRCQSWECTWAYGTREAFFEAVTFRVSVHAYGDTKVSDDLGLEDCFAAEHRCAFVVSADEARKALRLNATTEYLALRWDSAERAFYWEADAKEPKGDDVTEPRRISCHVRPTSKSLHNRRSAGRQRAG